jgi:hypothetical protein
MAVVSVIKGFSGTPCTMETVQGVSVNNWRMTKQVMYTVIFDNIDEANSIAAETASFGGVSVPALGAAYSVGYPDLVLQRKHADLIKTNPYCYQVVCLFSGENSPLTQFAEKGWDDQETEEPVDRDADDNIIVNPVGDRIIGITRPYYDGIYRFTRNEATAANAQPNTWRGTVNTNIVTLDGYACAAGKLCMGKIGGIQTSAGAYYYWRNTYLIKYREDGWRRREACKGNYYWTGNLIGGSKEILPCLASDGVTPRERLLTATGHDLDVYQTAPGNLLGWIGIVLTCLTKSFTSWTKPAAAASRRWTLPSARNPSRPSSAACRPRPPRSSPLAFVNGAAS